MKSSLDPIPDAQLAHRRFLDRSATQPSLNNDLPADSAETGQKVRPALSAPQVRAARMLVNGVSRLIVGGAFVFAGALKIRDPARFALDVSHFRLLPNELVNPVALVLPGIEFVAGLLILSGVWLRASAFVIVGLTAVFLAAIASALARGLNIECGCFGTVGGRHVGLVSLAIDITLFSMAVWLAKTSKDTPWNNNFREAGAQDSATPIEASPKASAADGKVSL